MAAAATAISALVSSAISSMGQLGAAAERLGLTTGALAGLQHGAALAGISAEDLAGKLAKFQKHLSEAGQGGGEMLLALNQLGLRIENIKDLAPEEALGRFADALKATGNAADKIRITDAVLGKGGSELIPFLNQGSAGIAKMTEEAAKLGPVSGASVAAVRAVTQGWRQFQEAIAGIGRSLAVIAAPALTALTEGLASVAKMLAGFGSSNFSFFSEIVKTVLQLSAALWSISPPVLLFKGLLAGIEGIFGPISGMWEGFKTGALNAMFAIQVALGNLSAAWSLGWKAIVVTAADALNSIIKAANSILPDEAQIGLVNVDGIRKKLDKEAAEFARQIKEKMDAFNKGGADAAPGKGNPLPQVDRKPAAMEFGSKEAFSTIYGTASAQEKALAVANQQLGENKKATELLKRLLGAFKGAVDVGKAAL